MTRFVSIPIAPLGVLALFAMLALIGCKGGSNSNANGNANASPKTALISCTTGSPTSAHIQDAIYAGMLGKPYANDINHFNITASTASSPPVVKIVGWSAYKTEIINLVQERAVGCGVDSSSFADNGKTPCGANQDRIGCPTGYGPCGDICIPEGELCKVTNRPAEPGWYCVPKPSPSPAPTTKS